LDVGDVIYIQQNDDASRAVLFTVSASTVDNTGWFTIPVQYQQGSQIPKKDKICGWIFASTGAEDNTVSNVGVGQGVFKQRNVNDFEFYSLSGGTNTTIDLSGDTIVISSEDIYVIAGTYVDNTDTISLLRNDGNFVNITGVTDTFTTGGTYDNGTALITFDKNDGTSYNVDLSTLDLNDTYVTGGTLTQPTDNTNSGLINLLYSQDVSPSTYSIPYTDTFITGFTYNNNNTFTIVENNGDTHNVTFNEISGLTINGDLNISGNTTQNGNTTTNGTVDIIGSGTGCTFSVTGKTCLEGDLDVTGNVFVTGNLDYDGNLIVTGSTIISSGLTVFSGVSADFITITTTPTENNDLIQILGRNSSTGDVEYRDVKTIGNNITTVTGTTYSATTTDDVIGIDSSTNTVTLYLPDSVSSGRLRYDIKDIGVNSFNNSITIQAAGSDTIITTSVVSSFELSADGGAIILVNTGTGQWWQM
jgi:hypothetical protein